MNPIFRKTPEVKPEKRIPREIPKIPEREKEKEVEKIIPEEIKEKPPKEEKPIPAVSISLPPFLPPVKKSETLQNIEVILEEDLKDLYFDLPPQLQKDFKKKGEEAALKIEQLIKKIKVKAKEIFKLIIGWLKMIPGINKFFLEQEAKIKTEKIMRLKIKK